MSQSPSEERVILTRSQIVDYTDELFEAVRRNDAPAVKEWALKGASLVELEGQQRPALVQAAAQGMIAVLEALIEMKADPDTKGKDGATALIWATRLKQVESVKYLLTVCNPNIVDSFGSTALMNAVSLENVDEIVELLLPVSDLSKRNHQSKSAEDIAGDYKKAEVLRWIQKASLANMERLVQERLFQRRNANEKDVPDFYV